MIKALSTLVLYSFAVAFLQNAAIAQSGTGSYGLVWLNINPPECEIALDGQFLDKSVWLLSLAPGFHTLRVQKSGYKTDSSDFEISAGQSMHLDVSLHPALGLGSEEGYNVSEP